MMNPGFVKLFSEMEKFRGIRQPVMYYKDIVEILGRQVLLAGSEDFMFDCCESSLSIGQELLFIL